MSRHEVRILIMALVAGAAAAVSAAPRARAEPPEHPLRGGAWALQFQVDLSGFGSSVDLSAKRHFTDRSALGLAFSVFRSSSERGFADAGDNGFQFFDGSDSDGTSFQISAPYFFYPCPRPGVNIFLAAGPFVGWSHSDETRASLSIAQSDTAITMAISESDRRSVGARTEVGFEWFFTRRLSLFSSHGVAVSHSQQDSETLEERQTTSSGLRTSTRRSEESSISVSTTAAELGFSVYF